ncbi:MAG TPA: phosphomannomutase, partial [Novosphingobium capsulatum]|nr:phosphomannomutase [Novosphingobium capsulatum]
MTHHFDPTILREYDVRGVFGQTLGAEDARAIGRSFAARVIRGGGRCVAVGLDGRVSSPILEHALVEGLAAGGVDVVRIGLGPTPMLYFAAATLDAVDGAVMITGSHNPANHNGFKFVLHGRPFFGAQIAELGALAQAGAWTSGSGTVSSADVMDAYVTALLRALDGLDPAALARLALAWDAGNG